MKQLIVMRHAKSAWTTGAPTDFDRPLAVRGQRDAPRMARWLMDQALIPGQIVTSPAVRARQTAAYICEGLGLSSSDLVLEPKVYGADLSTLLKVVAALPDEQEVVMLVGHNPGLEDLVEYLTEPERGRHKKLLPTASIQVLELPGPWSSLGAGSARVHLSMRPKLLQK